MARYQVMRRTASLSVNDDPEMRTSPLEMYIAPPLEYTPDAKAWLSVNDDPEMRTSPLEMYIAPPAVGPRLPVNDDPEMRTSPLEMYTAAPYADARPMNALQVT